MTTSTKPVVAFGPTRVGIGSWEWLGEELAKELHSYYEVCTFSDHVPSCDVVIVIKELLPQEELENASLQSAIIYCPVDCYGSAAEIDLDGVRLRCCRKVVLHSERLRKYFQSYAPVDVLDHHLRFFPETTPVKTPIQTPSILWVGHRSHLSLLVDYVNRHQLPGRLEVLTNWDQGPDELNGTQCGFAGRIPVRIRRWTAERHLQAVTEADLAIDIKGTDFRQRHKPAAKALDFVASNLPLAMNGGSSPVEHLARMGFAVASSDDPERWLSAEYRAATERFGQWVRESLSLSQIGLRWRQLIDDVLSRNPVANGILQ